MDRKIILMIDGEGTIYTPSDLGFIEGDYEFFESEIFNEVSENVGGTRYTLSIYGNGLEGPIPHFHIRKNGKTPEACLCIFEAKYFSHANHQGELSKEDLKRIDKIMNLPYKIDPTITNWQEICNEWKSLNALSYAKYQGIKDTDNPPEYCGLKFSDQHPDAKPDNNKRKLI